MKENTGSVVMAVLSLGMAVLIVVITLVWWLSNAAFVVNVAHDMGVSGKMPDYIIYPSDTDAHLPFNESFIINTKLKDVKGRQVKPFDVSDKIGDNEPEQTVRVYYQDGTQASWYFRNDKCQVVYGDTCRCYRISNYEGLYEELERKLERNKKN